MYLADDASGSNELFVASTSSSHSQLTVPAGTLAGGRSFVLVYCENALGRATSAASVAFSDWALSVPSTTRTLTTATTTSSTVTFTVTDQLRAVGHPIIHRPRPRCLPAEWHCELDTTCGHVAISSLWCVASDQKGLFDVGA